MITYVFRHTAFRSPTPLICLSKMYTAKYFIIMHFFLLKVKWSWQYSSKVVPSGLSHMGAQKVAYLVFITNYEELRRWRT